MSVEYELNLCYGVILSERDGDELDKTLEEYLLDDPDKKQGEVYDDFHDLYFKYLNSWCGEERFLGIICYMPSTMIEGVYEVDGLRIAEIQNDVKNFYCFLEKHNLADLVLKYFQDPKRYLINFCMQGLTNNRPYDIIIIEREVNEMGYVLMLLLLLNANGVVVPNSVWVVFVITAICGFFVELQKRKEKKKNV